MPFPLPENRGADLLFVLTKCNFQEKPPQASCPFNIAMQALESFRLQRT